MRFQRGSTNRHIVRPALIKAAALIVMSVFILLCLSGTILAVDLTTPNSLTVNTQEGFKDDEGLKNEDLTVELYYVAQARNDIEPAKGYDTYTLVTTDVFHDLQDAIDAAQVADPEARTRWEQIAQDATALVRAGKGGAPAATGNTGKAISDLPAGLYLVLTHGKDAPIFFDNNGKGPVLTTAYTEKYEYHFAPQLIALPFKENGESMAETFNTGDANAEWNNDMTIVLKGERNVPPEKPGTGDSSDLATQRVLFITSGIVILLLAAILAVMKKRGMRNRL